MVLDPHTLRLQVAQSRAYLHTLGPKVGIIYILGALLIGSFPTPGLQAVKKASSVSVDPVVVRPLLPSRMGYDTICEFRCRYVKAASRARRPGWFKDLDGPNVAQFRSWVL